MQVVNLLLNTIDELFNILKVRLFGEYAPIDKRVISKYYNQFKDDNNLIKLYNLTIKTFLGDKYFIQDNKLLDYINSVNFFLDKNKNELINVIQKLPTVLKDTLDDPNVIQSILSSIQDSIKFKINTIIAYESTRAVSRASADAIKTVAASVNIADPIVCKIGVLDNKICSECLKLWHLPNNPRIPKVYKLSELHSNVYSTRQNPIPTIEPTHPHCRHILTIITDGYGFDDNGNLKFIDLKYNEYDKQRNL